MADVLTWLQSPEFLVLVGFHIFIFLMLALDLGWFQRQAHAERTSAQPDVVCLRAGEVLQCRAELLRRDRAAVDLESVARVDRAFRVASQQDSFHGRECGEGDEDMRRVTGGDDEVQIADGVAAAAKRAGDLDLLSLDLDGVCSGPLFGPSKIIRELSRPPGKQGIVHRAQTKDVCRVASPGTGREDWRRLRAGSCRENLARLPSPADALGECDQTEKRRDEWSCCRAGTLPL